MPYLSLLKEPTTEKVSWICFYTFSFYTGPNLPTLDGHLAFEICAHVLSNAQRVQSALLE
jgi:hypothetical protein